MKRARNSIEQYDDLVDEWSRPEGAFAALHWLADSRRALVPASRTGESSTALTPIGDVLVDVGCGGGLLADPTSSYRHIGVDLTASALQQARLAGIAAVRADASRIPLASHCAAVVVAGEILEHVVDLEATVEEICRILQPGGTVIIDTLNDTRMAKFALVTVAEHLPGGPPPGIHDPGLFVAPQRLQKLFRLYGVVLEVWGLRPSLRDYVRFLLDRRRHVRMVRTRSTALVYQGLGVKVAG